MEKDINDKKSQIWEIDSKHIEDNREFKLVKSDSTSLNCNNETRSLRKNISKDKVINLFLFFNSVNFYLYV